MKHGQLVTTPFGDGHVLSYRPEDNVYEIELPFATLYLTLIDEDDDDKPGKEEDRPVTDGSTSHVHQPQLQACPESDATSYEAANDLNLLYESLEKMRRLNLELACEERNIEFKESALQECSQCLLTRPPSPKSKTEPTTSTSNNRFPRLRKLVDVPKRHVEQLAKQSMRKPPKPCLICSAPTCGSHASTSFAKEHITVCMPCEHLFSVDYIVECLTAPTPEDRLFLMDRMMDVYDRTLLVLKYSLQFMEPAAQALEASAKRTNRVHMGSSGAGVVSGVLGVCAAATILTPAGPPLLVASLLFGGSATAVQTSTDLRNYYSEPSQLADRVIALHGMVRSILRLTKTLHQVITQDHLQSGMYDNDDETDNSGDAAILSARALDKDTLFESRAMVGMTASRAAAAGVEFASLAATAEFATLASTSATASSSMTAVAETAAMNAGLLNRSGMVLLNTARVARFAGGALSAATVVLEAKCLNDTLTRIRAGNPCEKADVLRQIEQELDYFPVTSELSAELEHYLGFMARRRRNMSEEEAREAMRDYGIQKSIENSLILVSEDEESQVEEQNLLVNEFLSSDPATGRSLPAGTESTISNNVPLSGKERPTRVPPLTAFSKPNWGQARASVVGVGNDLASSFRGGLVSLRNQAQRLQKSDGAAGVKDTPAGSVKLVTRSNEVDDADRSFDESLTA